MIDDMIHSLEAKRMSELNSLKAQLRLTGESFKPANLMKSAAEEFTSNKKLKSYIIQAGIGLILSLITKKIVKATRSRKASSLVENVADASLNHLTSNQAALVKIAAPILVGLAINLIRRKKRKW
jgi:hypothetical protein